MYLASLGFSMIPGTVAMGHMASRVNDRVLTVFSMSLTLVGCLQIMNGGYPRSGAHPCTGMQAPKAWHQQRGQEEHPATEVILLRP